METKTSKAAIACGAKRSITEKSTRTITAFLFALTDADIFIISPFIVQVNIIPGNTCPCGGQSLFFVR
jgi:hypothetical protein